MCIHFYKEHLFPITQYKKPGRRLGYSPMGFLQIGSVVEMYPMNPCMAKCRLRDDQGPKSFTSVPLKIDVFGDEKTFQQTEEDVTLLEIDDVSRILNEVETRHRQDVRDLALDSG